MEWVLILVNCHKVTVFIVWSWLRSARTYRHLLDWKCAFLGSFGGYQVVEIGYFTTGYLLHKVPLASCGSRTLRRVTARNHLSLCSNDEWPSTQKTFPLQKSRREDRDEGRTEKEGHSAKRKQMLRIFLGVLCCLFNSFFHCPFFPFLPLLSPFTF